MRNFPEYHRYDGLGLAELVAKKEVTPLELAEEAIDRIETYNPVINAVIYKMYDQARLQAKSKLPGGRFSGVPFLLKDALDTLEGEPTSSGTALLRNIPQKHDSETVKRFRAAGLVFLGKTNLPELSLLPVTGNRMLSALRITPGISTARPAVPAAVRRPRSRLV